MKDNTLIVIITAFCTYLLFFLSENYLHVSGILALVSLGVYLGTFCKVHLTHSNDHAVHTIWSFVGFTLETLIFLITGTFIGAKVGEFDLSYIDLIKVLFFYFMLMVVRTVVIFIQLPFLNLVGKYSISKLSALILSYGGLRGAIALSLGMLVALDDRFNKDFQQVCLLYVVVVIICSVCINGMTIKFLMIQTGFLEEDVIKKNIKKSLSDLLFFTTHKKKLELGSKSEFGGVTWNSVDKLTKLDKFYEQKKKMNQDIDKMIPNINFESQIPVDIVRNLGQNDNSAPSTKLQNIKDADNKNSSETDEENKQQILSEVRFRVYRLIKHQIHEKRDNNECTSQVVRALKNVCDICAEHLQKEICIHEYSKIYISNHWILELVLKMSKIPLIGTLFSKSFASNIFFEFQFLETVNSCLERVEHELRLGSMDLFSPEIVKKVCEEMKQAILELEKLENSITLYFEEYVSFIKTKTAAYSLIQFQKQQINEFEHFGMIDEKEKEDWIALLDRQVVKVNRYKPQLNAQLKHKFVPLVLDFPLFSGLEDDEISAVLEVKAPKIIKKDTIIYSKDEPCDYLYLVNTGMVDEIYYDNDEGLENKEYKAYQKGKFSVLCIGNMTNPNKTNLCMVKAISDCKIFRIQKSKPI